MKIIVMDLFTHPEIAPLICSLITTECPIPGINAEDLSVTLQKAFGTELVYSVLSKELNVTLHHVLHLNYLSKDRSCPTRGASARLFSEEEINKSGSTDWEINIILSNIDKMNHISVLLVNSKLKIVEYFEPNGSTHWTLACGNVLAKWSSSHYDDYLFIYPEEVCPTGAQSILGQGTCWLWSSLYFYLRIQCPTIDPSVLNESLITMDKDDLDMLITKFGCYLLEISKTLNLDVITPLYFKSQKILRTDMFDPTVADFSKYLENLYLNANLDTLSQIILSSDEIVPQLMDKDPELIQRAQLCF